MDSARPGELCASEASYCDGSDTLLRCLLGRWTPLDCELACSSASRGCLLFGRPSTPTAGCLCDDGSIIRRAPSNDPPPPFDACVDAETLVACDTETCTEHDCTDVCADASPDYPTSRGCRRDTCWCSAVGTPCGDDEPPRCEDDYYLLACLDGAWSVTDCTVRCRLMTVPECVVRDDEGAACNCDP